MQNACIFVFYQNAICFELLYSGFVSYYPGFVYAKNQPCIFLTVGFVVFFAIYEKWETWLWLSQEPTRYDRERLKKMAYYKIVELDFGD